MHYRKQNPVHGRATAPVAYSNPETEHRGQTSICIVSRLVCFRVFHGSIQPDYPVDSTFTFVESWKLSFCPRRCPLHGVDGGNALPSWDMGVLPGGGSYEMLRAARLSELRNRSRMLDFRGASAVQYSSSCFHIGSSASWGLKATARWKYLRAAFSSLASNERTL